MSAMASSSGSAAPPTGTAAAAAAAALPPTVSPALLPFPTIGLPTRIEPLPSYSWMPTMASLFPSQPAATLPDISSLSLSSGEYNRLAYEQLLLSTQLLSGVDQAEHRATLLSVVRVQLHITQGEHELLMRVLTAERGVLPNSPTHALSEAERAAQTSQPSQRPSLSDSQPDDSPSAAHSAPSLAALPHVSESMQYVNYRLSLLRSVASSRFPSLHAYRVWFERQVHAVWLAILWTMQMQVKASSNNGHDSGVSSLPLSRFKHTLQLVQLLPFSLQAKIRTNVFVLGDSVNDADHADLLARIGELDDILRSFPAPYTSVLNDALHYPTPMLHRAYRHLLRMSCISGADHDGRPALPDPAGDGADSNDSGDESDSEGGLSLHPSYLSILDALSSVRALWKVSEFSHQYALLHVILHILYYQSVECDGKLLDAEGMTAGDHSLLPLLSHVSSAFSSRLRAESAAAVSGGASNDKRTRVDQLDDEEIQFLCFALRNFGYALADFHQFHSDAVAACFQLYHDLCVWLGVRDVSARLHQFLHISTTNFYQTLIPTEQTLMMPTMQMKMQSNESSSGGGGGVALPSAPPPIERTLKPLHTWSSDEWRTFSTRMCAFIQDQIEDIQPALTSKSTLASVFGSRPRGAGECVDSSDEQRPNVAEVCIMQMLRCFAQDVRTLTDARVRARAGMDDTLLSLVSSLVRVQTLLMDSRFANFWTSMAVKRQLATSLPNLADLCTAALARWLDVQKGKVEGIRERCVLTDKWTPVDDASGLLFSHSVPDLFAFLHTVGDAFWQHARSLHGYGVAASLPLLVDLLNNTLQQYSAHVLHTAGMDVLPHIYPTTDVKLKQAKAEPTDKDKAKAFVKGLFKKDKPVDPQDDDAPPADLVRRGLVVQSLQSLCVRLCCIEAAIDQSADLSQSLLTQSQSLVNDFPIVAPASRRSSVDAKDAGAASDAAIRRWEEWSGCFSPPARLPKSDAANIFLPAVEHMRKYIEQLSLAVGVSQVYVAWRWSWLTKLYAPTPLESNRIKNGVLENQIEEAMPVVHAHLSRTLFPIVAKHIFTQLMSAVQYVLLYGRRSIQVDQLTFSKIVHPLDLERATKEITQLASVMQIPTDDLIQMYNSNKCPLPLPVMARIIAARSGKHAQKLIDKIRGKK